MKRFLLSIQLLAGSLLGGCAPAPAEPAPKPALWKVADADTTIYLFGNVHTLRPNTNWRTKTFDDAVTKSQQLVLEILPDGVAEQQAAAMKALAYSAGLPPILERVAPEKRAALKELIEQSGIPEKSFDELETWAVALILSASTQKSLNAEFSEGAERQLGDNFKRAGKPIFALESVEEQMRLFDTIPEAAQRRFLTNVVDDTPNANASFTKMVNAWLRGDTKEIEAIFDKEVQRSPGLVEALFRHRNAAWAEWIRKRLNTPGTIMVAVGTGHLVGTDSVLSLLQAQGLTVERVQ